MQGDGIYVQQYITTATGSLSVNGAGLKPAADNESRASDCKRSLRRLLLSAGSSTAWLFVTILIKVCHVVVRPARRVCHGDPLLGKAANSTTGGENCEVKKKRRRANPDRLLCYLVRLWQDSPYTPWRAAAQSVQSGETVRFADVEQLFAFLRTQTTQGATTASSKHLSDTPDVNRE